MAAKKNNTLLWLGVFGVGGYLYYQYTQKQAATAATVPNASTGTLLLPPAPAINTNLPASVPAASNAPGSVLVDTTGLVPITQAGQPIALNPNLTPVTNAQGQPMTFASTSQGNQAKQAFDSMMYANYQKGILNGPADGDCV